MRRSLILAGGAALLVAAGAVTTSPAGAAPTCVPIDTTGQPTLGNNPGPQALSYFAADFPAVQVTSLATAPAASAASSGAGSCTIRP